MAQKRTKLSASIKSIITKPIGTVGRIIDGVDQEVDAFVNARAKDITVSVAKADAIHKLITTKLTALETETDLVKIDKLFEEIEDLQDRISMF